MSKSTDRFERSRRNTFLYVYGEKVDPLLVRADLGANADALVELHLDLGIAMTLHELSEAEISIPEDELGRFIIQDVEQHGNAALDGYLDLAWAAMANGKKKPKTKLSPKWKWTQIVGARRSGVVVTLYGKGRASSD